MALSILYLHVARAQGWQAEGLAFPGHFLIRVEIDGARHVIDPFHDGCARDAADLRQTLQDLRNKHMVLIDTIGMSQRDKMVADQAAMLHSAGNVRRLLCLNATASGETLDDVLRAYEGHDLAGCILTKVDEAGALAPDDAQVWYVRGEVLRTRRDAPGAIAAYGEAITRDANHQRGPGFTR